MKSILSCSLILLCMVVSAQQKEEKKPSQSKVDSIKIFNSREIPAKADTDKKSQYTMFFIKPKDTSAYMALKEQKRDYSKYRILNAALPEKPKTDTKKAEPSK